MNAEDSQASADLLLTTLRHEQSEKVGRVVDESVERAARHRAERVERDRIERENERDAEQRAGFEADRERADAARAHEWEA